MDRTRRIFFIFSFVIVAILVVRLVPYAFQTKANQNAQATSDILEMLYQDCVASKRVGDLQAAYAKCGQLVSLAPTYADGQTQLIDVREQLLADYYAIGVAAFNQELWAESILWFDKILELDLSYRDTTELKARAMANSGVVTSTTIQTVSPTPTSSPVATTRTPQPVIVATVTTDYISRPTGSNLLANGNLDEDDFGSITSWANANIDLYRWHLVQNTPPSAATNNARWIDWVDLSDVERGYGLKSTDYQGCSAWCSTSAVQIVPAQENQSYTLSAEAVIGQGTGGGTLYMDFLNASRGRLKPYTKGGYGNEWSTQEITAVAPAGTKYIRAILYTGNKNQGVIYWDNVELKEN